jgi:hypothetical protein
LFHPSSDCGDLTVGDHSADNLSGTTNTCPEITGEATEENSEENSGVQIDIGAGAESEEESASSQHSQVQVQLLARRLRQHPTRDRSTNHRAPRSRHDLLGDLLRQRVKPSQPHK